MEKIFVEGARLEPCQKGLADEGLLSAEGLRVAKAERQKISSGAKARCFFGR